MKSLKVDNLRIDYRIDNDSFTYVGQYGDKTERSGDYPVVESIHLYVEFIDVWVETKDPALLKFAESYLDNNWKG